VGSLTALNRAHWESGCDGEHAYLHLLAALDPSLLNYLIDLCAPLDLGFEQFRAPADELNPYAVESRYPDTLPLVPLGSVRAKE
jgi:hypothetical protein